jgi:hypothetical protein
LSSDLPGMLLGSADHPTENISCSVQFSVKGAGLIRSDEPLPTVVENLDDGLGRLAVIDVQRCRVNENGLVYR